MEHSHRVLVYSHDTYGLGHLRRSLRIAEELARRDETGPVLVVTGSPRAQSFHVPAGVDTLKLPAATKGPDGYRSRTLGVELTELVQLRSSLLLAAADAFRPDLVLVDHAPVGMEGELWELLRRYVGSTRRPKLVLGLRDIIDDHRSVDAEWTRADAWRVIDRLYDDVLVYGDGSIRTTAQELDLERRLGRPVPHVGYVTRGVAGEPRRPRPLVAVTAGGGGDGEPLLRAYAGYLEQLGSAAPFDSVVVTGPLLSSRRRAELTARFAATGASVTVEDFVDGCEHLFARADAVVAMAGYNTVGEILASGAPALLVPRERPRAEQRLRAERLAELGVVSTARVDQLDPDLLDRFVRTALATDRRAHPSIRLDGAAGAADHIVGLLEGSPVPAPRSVGTVSALPPASGRTRIGYVLKKFPRLSETFVLNEILAVERAGVDVSVFSLRPPDEEIRHAALASLQAPVTTLRRVGEQDVDALLAARVAPTFGPAAAARCRAFLGRLPGREQASVLGQALQLAEAVDRDEISHLHAHFMTVAARTAYVAHLLTGVPFSVTAHAKDIYRHGVDAGIFAEVAAAAVAVVTVCEANRRFIREQLVPAGAGRVEVVYNGVAVDRRAAGDQPRRTPLVLGVGRLVEKKGFEVLIRACRHLRDRGVPFECLIVGDGEERERLVEVIGDEGLAACVRLTGPLPSEQVLELMKLARVVAAPCITGDDGNRDALPTVLLEALANGTPIVATPVGGIPEIVEHGREGLVVPERDPELLADALRRLLQDDRRWLAMSGAARAKAVATFDRDSAVSQLLSLIDPDRPVTAVCSPAPHRTSDAQLVAAG